MKSAGSTHHERVADSLLRFVDAFATESPMYSAICRGVVDNDVVHRILGAADRGQPLANLLLGGVHFLLADRPDSALASHYPSIVGPATAPVGDIVNLFVGFCEEREEELRRIVTTRTVQTNEVRRCVGLFPAFARIAAAEHRPLALLEIGASAGLNLLFDRYRYDYGGTAAGALDAPVLLRTELRGTTPLLDPPPTVSWRRGIDLHPVDITDPDAVRWARSLLWPDQLDRIERFDQAVRIAQADPPHIVAGEAVATLERVASEAPADADLVVFHTFVLNQFTADHRSRLDETISRVSRSRPLHRIGIDMMQAGLDGAPIAHTFLRNGAGEVEHLGRMHHHGAWLEWT